MRSDESMSWPVHFRSEVSQRDIRWKYD